ncbi:MAG TPA: tryptophan synthase subunit alpha [Candidatus Binataceae bacterium]|nr:tryptophan synthase subunit alpha [Candidatus Binataceae bacterium]
MQSNGRIARMFAQLRARNEAALIPFIFAGDPDLEHTQALALELAQRGADLIELGIPFSDPMADGPANQRAGARGMAGGGTLSAVLGMVSQLRQFTQVPLILFGYANPFLHYGSERLCADAGAAGVDGLLMVDMPPEESGELAQPARAAGLDLIYLLAPTTPLERARRIARAASGFLYYVSVTGVTGARTEVAADLAQHIQALRQVTELPLGVGFGISTPAQAAQVASYADAVIVGSVLSQLIEACGKSERLLPTVCGLVAEMKQAMRGARGGAQVA